MQTTGYRPCSWSAYPGHREHGLRSTCLFVSRPHACLLPTWLHHQNPIPPASFLESEPAPRLHRPSSWLWCRPNRHQNDRQVLSQIQPHIIIYGEANRSRTVSFCQNMTYQLVRRTTIRPPWGNEGQRSAVLGYLGSIA